MSMHPKHAAPKAPRRGTVARLLVFMAGFALAGAGAALAFFVVNVIDASGNNAVAQATHLSAPLTPATASEASATSAAVTWTLPGSQLSGAQYLVVASPGGETCLSSGTSCTVNGLTVGTGYIFSISAVLDRWQSPSVTATFTTLGVTTTTLNTGTVDGSYSSTLAATGGTGAYTWALTTGTLPPGLSLTASTGAITGTPTTTGPTSGLVFTVTDKGGTGVSATSPSLSIVVNEATSSTALSLSPSSTVTYGSEQSTTFNVTVTPHSPTAPTGTVQVKNGSTVLCTTGSLNASGQASCALTATQLSASGTAYPITAVYGGDANFNGSTSSPAQNLTVNPDTATVTAFTASPSSATYGSETSLSFSATVTGGGTATIPTGDTVKVAQGATTLCTISLTSGSGSCSPTTAIALGASGSAYTVTATFNAAGTDTNFVSTATNTTNVTVNKATPTTAVSFTSPITYGHETTETFNATVTGVTGGTAPIGTVTVFDGSNPLCTTTGLNATGNHSSASCSLTSIQLAGGTYSGATGITATFNPVVDPNYQTSSSTAQPLTVNKDTTSATVSVSPASEAFAAENSATFTATVTTTNGEVLPGTESGTINVGTTTCTVSLTPSGSGGSGTCNIGASALNAQVTAYAVTFTYGGDPNDLSASSQATAAGGFTVNKANQTITFTSTNPSPVSVGAPTYTPTATSTSGLTVTITLNGSSTGCTLSSGVVTFTAAGTCLVDANIASSTNFNAASQVQQSITVTSGKLVITSTAVDGSSSSTPNLGAITVQRQNGSGTPITTGGALTVNLSSSPSSGATFGTTQFDSTPVTTVSIPSGQSSTTFWYGATSTGTPTITAAATGFTSGTQQETITTAPVGLAISITGGSGSPSDSCGTIGSSYTCNVSGVGSGGNVTFQVEFVNGSGTPVVYSTTQASSITEARQNSGTATIAAGATTSTGTALTASHAGESTKTSTLTFGPYTLTISVSS
jgi:hypothetical protein